MKQSIFAGLLLSLAVFAVQAGNVPSWYPASFMTYGVIDDVDAKEGRVVIEDRAYYLPASVNVSTMKSEFGTTRRLKPGQRIAYRLKAVNPVPVISQVWVIPKNFPKSRLKEQLLRI